MIQCVLKGSLVMTNTAHLCGSCGSTVHYLFAFCLVLQLFVFLFSHSQHS